MQPVEANSSGRNVPMLVVIVLAALVALGAFFAWPG